MRNLAPKFEAVEEGDLPHRPTLNAPEQDSAADLPDPDEEDYPYYEDDEIYPAGLIEAEEPRSRSRVVRRAVLGACIVLAACFAVAPTAYFLFFRAAVPETAATAGAEIGSGIAGQQGAGNLKPAEKAVRTAPAEPLLPRTGLPQASPLRPAPLRAEAARATESTAAADLELARPLHSGLQGQIPASPAGTRIHPAMLPGEAALPRPQDRAIAGRGAGPTILAQRASEHPYAVKSSEAEPLGAVGNPTLLIAPAPLVSTAAARRLAPAPPSRPGETHQLAAGVPLTAVGGMRPPDAVAVGPGLPLQAGSAGPLTAGMIHPSSRADQPIGRPAAEAGVREHAALLRPERARQVALVPHQPLQSAFGAPLEPEPVPSLMAEAERAGPADLSEPAPSPGLLQAEAPIEQDRAEPIVVASLLPLDALLPLVSSGAVTVGAPQLQSPEVEVEPISTAQAAPVVPPTSNPLEMVRLASLGSQEGSISPMRPRDLLSPIPGEFDAGRGALIPALRVGPALEAMPRTPKPRPAYEPPPSAAVATKETTPSRAKVEARAQAGKAQPGAAARTERARPAARQASPPAAKAQKAVPRAAEAKPRGQGAAAKAREAKPKRTAKPSVQAKPRQERTQRRNAQPQTVARPQRSAPARSAAPPQVRTPQLPAALLPTQPPRQP